jgi:hypothetical protein
MHQTLHSGLEVDGILRDLEERRLTFELLTHHAPSPDDVDRTKLALAVEAVTYAQRAYTFGLTNHAIGDNLRTFIRALPPKSDTDFGPVDRLISFARETYPDIVNTSLWNGLERAQTKPSSRLPLPALAADVAGRTRRKALWWPWKRLGS